MYLGCVEVQFIILLVSCQILVLVVNGRSYQHHPVAIIFTTGVKTHHYSVSLEDLTIKGGKKGGKNLKKKIAMKGNSLSWGRASTIISSKNTAPSVGTVLHSPGDGPA